MAQYQTAAPTVDVSLDSKIIVNDVRDEIVAQVRQEHKAGFEYKRGRYGDWNLNEDEYYNRTKKSLLARFDVPFPFMSGFIDTYKSKIKERLTTKFEDTREAGYRAALKIQSFYEEEARDEDSDWESVDLDTDQYALLNGRGINDQYPEVINGKFRFCLVTVDPYDFYDEGTKGGNGEAHDYNGIDNILSSKYQMLELAKAGYYDMKQVLKLLNTEVTKTQRVADDLFMAKQNRLISLGLDNKTYITAGQSKYKLIKSGTTFRGQRWLVTWNRETGIWIRCVPLKNVFNSGLWTTTSWSPKREAHNSWPLGPADDFRPVSVAMKVFLNQELDNRNKKNWDMRAFDPDMFTDPTELEWRPGGLVAIKSGATKTRRIDAGIYRFETADLSGNINMVQYLDNLAGTKLGINSATQGQASEDKVGIFLGNQAAVADRIEATSIQRRKNQIARARRFLWAAYQYLPEPQAVKIIGEQGLGWDKLRKNEINPELKIRIEGGNSQIAMNEAKATKKAAALTAISADPSLANVVNPKWRAEQILLNGEVPQAEMADALDMDDYGNKTLMAKAAEALDDLAAGKYPPICYDANTKFVRRIMDAAFADKADLKPVIFDRFVAYANAHIPIAARNAARSAMLKQATAGALQPPSGPNPVDAANAAANGLPQPPIQPSMARPMPTKQVMPAMAPAVGA